MIGSTQGDSRIKVLLDELDVRYEVDSDGDFAVSFQLKDDRTQTAFIRSQTSTLGKFEIREIFSIAQISDRPLDANLANALLVYNAHVKIGSWRLLRLEGERCVVAFAAQIDANTDSKSLLTALHAVLHTADEVESKLDSRDRF